MKRTNEVPEVRVLLLADTHGVVDERVAALAQGCAWIVHAGDVGNAAVLRTLARSGRGAQLAAVRGNNDIPAKWPTATGQASTRCRET